MKQYNTPISSVPDASNAEEPASGNENSWLPFERDETADPGNRVDPETPGLRDVIQQAARDIKQGLRDTDQHGIPSDVPGPGLDPEETPGADVPWQEEGTSKQDNAHLKKTP